VLYQLVGHEIEASFVEARKRLSLGQGASDATSPGVSEGEGRGAVPDPVRDAEPPRLDPLVPRIPAIPRTTDIQMRLVADLNLMDVSPSPRRRLSSR
jgi:hypothetical protein